jgi:hypothetical protein
MARHAEISRRVAVLVAALVAVLAFAQTAAAAVPFRDLGSAAGPLVHVVAGADLSCQAQHVGDPAVEFAPLATSPGDCGTFVAVDGVVYAPDFISHGATATTPLGTYTPYAQRSQAADGANGATTVVDLPGSGLQITQTDSYLPGQDAFRTDVTVTNAGAAPKSLVLYRAGDCFIQGPGTGYGFAGSPDGSAGCSAQPNNAPVDRVVQWVPITGGNDWVQTSATDLWTRIASGAPFPSQCIQCMNETDAAAGLSWAITVAPGASETRSHWTVVSPTGRTGPPLPVAAPPVKPTTSTVGGTVIRFTGPVGCIRPPRTYRLRVTSMRKKKISKDRFGYVRRVRILKVEFLVDGKRRLTDRKAAFQAILPTAGAAPGAHALGARVTLQPLRERGPQRFVGKPFTKTLRSVVNVCG